MDNCEREDDWGGRAEKVMDAPFVPVDDDRPWGGKRGLAAVTGVPGACAMWPTPAGPRSMLSTVVGLVLAAMLLKVRELDRYEEEEWEREGEGGELGGSGRREASSSASRALAGDHKESRASDER
jgi:hypothetical protein